jgi:hypothetical protein
MASSPSSRLHVLAVRLTPGERAVLAGRARVAGVPVSTYLRQAALARPLKRGRNRATHAGVEELGRLGRRLNQFAHAANVVHRIAAPEELAQLLEEIREKIAEVSAGPGA